MCGVVAAFNPIGVNMDSFIDLLKQSAIRGHHATGISWLEKGMIKSYVKPLKASLFKLPEIKTTAIIGHCRYSTSDLEFNQPIIGEKYAIAHNGVVSQISPECWELVYGLKTTGKNDTELLLRSFEQDCHPLERFPEASMAVATVLTDRYGSEIGFFRNGQRPLWYNYEEEDNVCWVASTKNIFLRTKSLEGLIPVKCDAGHHYRVNADNGFMVYDLNVELQDLQV